jgi:hypothetical protein
MWLFVYAKLNLFTCILNSKYGTGIVAYTFPLYKLYGVNFFTAKSDSSLLLHTFILCAVWLFSFCGTWAVPSWFIPFLNRLVVVYFFITTEKRPSFLLQGLRSCLIGCVVLLLWDGKPAHEIGGFMGMKSSDNSFSLWKSLPWMDLSGELRGVTLAQCQL